MTQRSARWQRSGICRVNTRVARHPGCWQQVLIRPGPWTLAALERSAHLGRMADPARDEGDVDRQAIRGFYEGDVDRQAIGGVQAGRGDRLAEAGAPAGCDEVPRRMAVPAPGALPSGELARARALARHAAILRENAMVARASRQAAGDRTAASPEQAATAPERAKGGRDRFWAAIGQKQGSKPTDAPEPAERAPEVRDDVVQTLYGVGLNLQALLSEARQPELRGALEQAVNDIDVVVASLRSHFGQLGCGVPGSHPPSGSGRLPD